MQCTDRTLAHHGPAVFFPNFFLGEQYEHASKNNRLITSIVPTGRFRNCQPMHGLAIEPGDHFSSFTTPGPPTYSSSTSDARRWSVAR